LIEVESIDSDELKLIVDENSPGPLVVPGTTPVGHRTGLQEGALDAGDKGRAEQMG
jgi:cell division protease FtsH